MSKGPSATNLPPATLRLPFQHYTHQFSNRIASHIKVNKEGTGFDGMPKFSQPIEHSYLG